MITPSFFYLLNPKPKIHSEKTTPTAAMGAFLGGRKKGRKNDLDFPSRFDWIPSPNRKKSMLFKKCFLMFYIDVKRIVNWMTSAFRLNLSKFLVCFCVSFLLLVLLLFSCLFFESVPQRINFIFVFVFVFCFLLVFCFLRLQI